MKVFVVTVILIVALGSTAATTSATLSVVKENDHSNKNNDQQNKNNDVTKWLSWLSSSSSSSSSTSTATTSSKDLHQFSCTLAAKDESSCQAATADDGSNCVWCSLSGIGFCVTEQQAQSMEKVIPTIKCDDGPKPKTDDAVTPPTNAPSADSDPNGDVWKCLQQKDEASCKKANDEAAAGLDEEEAERLSAGSGCTWCTSKAGYGLCLAKVEADFAARSKWFHCAKEEHDNKDEQQHEDEVKSNDEEDDEVQVHTTGAQQVSDFDTSCLVASLEQDASFCISTMDATSNQACKWCYLTSAPTLQLCMSSDQASMASMFVTCDTAATTTYTEAKDPMDMSCVEVSMIQDESVCEATTDVTGQACEWCNVPRIPYHVCLSKDQANMVAGIVDCSKTTPLSFTEAAAVAAPERDVVAVVKKQKTSLLRSSASNNQDNVSTTKNNHLQEFDPSCLLVSLEQDASVCQASHDGTSGAACEWCHVTSAPSIHLCLSSDQVTLATDLVSCDATAEPNSKDDLLDREEQKEDEVNDPTDLTCLELSLLQDESACEATSDTSGQACEYCSVPQLPFHVCLSQEQAALVAGLVSCSSGPSPSSSPGTFRADDVATTTTANNNKIGFPANLIKCLKTMDEPNCQKTACTWCDTQIGFGVCLPPAAADATDNCPFFDCNGPHHPKHDSSPISNDESSTTITGVATTTTTTPDINCWAAGMTSDDAQSVCQSTLDHEGSTCVWCDAADSGFGLCLSSEQAQVAGKWLHCSSSNSASASAIMI